MKQGKRKGLDMKRVSALAVTMLALVAAPAWAQAEPENAGHSGMEPSTTQGQTPMNGTMDGAKDSGMSNDHMPTETGPGAQHDKPAGQAVGDASGTMGHDGMNMQGGSAPPDARDPHAYSDGYTLDSGKYALPGPRQLRMADEHNFGGLLVDRIESQHTSDGNVTAYDAQAWFGRDYNRLVIKAEGDYGQGKLQEARAEALWGHAIATFWDTQLGARYDSGLGPDRGWLAFGVQGLAPYWFDVEATAYAGSQGRTAVRLAASYDLPFTQKLILQPRIELNAYGKNDEARGIGSGLADGAAGLRLRYEFTRQIAPYVGVERAERFGKTADLARAAGEGADETRWVAGVRFWF